MCRKLSADDVRLVEREKLELTLIGRATNIRPHFTSHDTYVRFSFFDITARLRRGINRVIGSFSSYQTEKEREKDIEIKSHLV